MYHNVLVALDLYNEAGNGKILDTVRRHFSGDRVTLHLVTILPHDEGLGILSQFVPKGFEETLAGSAEEKLQAIITDLRSDFGGCETHIQSGNVYVEVLNVAESIAADLIVLGSSKPELQDYLLGPSAARIMRHATCSALIVR